MEELRRGTRICNPHFLPDNTYGNQSPIEIEQDLEAQESPHPMNEEDDLGTLYSANFWRKIIASGSVCGRGSPRINTTSSCIGS